MDIYLKSNRMDKIINPRKLNGYDRLQGRAAKQNAEIAGSELDSSLPQPFHFPQPNVCTDKDGTIDRYCSRRAGQEGSLLQATRPIW